MQQDSTRRGNASLPDLRWVAPAQGTLKIYVDASVIKGANFFSVGMVARDHQGLFMRGKTMKFAGQVSVLEAKMVGILEALIWFSDLPDQSIIVESDSMLSIQAITKAEHNQLEIGNLIEQCLVKRRGVGALLYAPSYHPSRIHAWAASEAVRLGVCDTYFKVQTFS
ncbi:uncharacterized protein LOC141686368 [Apium graveolens]|uniref:uncharacterized protein LOC141686368 n=1 Tax=Apium graveolens TaxID=4045 RepID=UPI003D792737